MIWFVGKLVLGWWLDLMILGSFPALVILWFSDPLQSAAHDNLNAVQLLVMESPQRRWIIVWGVVSDLSSTMGCNATPTVYLVKPTPKICPGKVRLFCMYPRKINRNSSKRNIRFSHLFEFLQWESAEFRLVTKNSPVYIWGWKNNHVTSLERDLKFTEVNEKAPVVFKWIQPLHGEQKTCVSSA